MRKGPSPFLQRLNDNMRAADFAIQRGDAVLACAHVYAASLLLKFQLPPRPMYDTRHLVVHGGKVHHKFINWYMRCFPLLDGEIRRYKDAHPNEFIRVDTGGDDE